MAAPGSKFVQLAKSLPPRLQTFLARYPPASILPSPASSSSSSSSSTSTSIATAPTPTPSKTGYQQDTPNPFLPTRLAATGRWHDPVYSLRRQAELCKLAQAHGVEELLPFSTKSSAERLSKRVALGLRVKGTGVGQRVKGQKHERDIYSKYVAAAWRWLRADASGFAVVSSGLWARAVARRRMSHVFSVDRLGLPVRREHPFRSYVVLTLVFFLQNGEEEKSYAGHG